MAHHLDSLRPDELSFLKSETGITDDAALKDHVIKIQEKAYSVSPFTARYMFSTYSIPM
jgi:hypothetical protein